MFAMWLRYNWLMKNIGNTRLFHPLEFSVALSTPQLAGIISWHVLVCGNPSFAT